MKYTVFAIFLLISACTQTSPARQEKIRVTGEGKIRVKPDLVTLTVQVSFTEPRMASAVKTTQQTINSVLAILAPYSQSENDIKTSSISANKEYEYSSRKPIFVGYKAEQSLNFVLNDIGKFTELTGKLLGTKISSISRIQFGHSQADSLFREADLLAHDDALKSAQKLCKRANVGLGKLLFLTNVQDGNLYNESAAYEVAQEVSTYAKGFGGSGFKISPEVLEFKRTVVSEYAIAP
ncbi:MAG: SIMPL domain-containing protein [Adhaeribacter sp.]